MYQEAVFPSLTASTKLAVPHISPPAKIFLTGVYIVLLSKKTFPVLGLINEDAHSSVISAPKAVTKTSHPITYDSLSEDTYFKFLLG